MSFIELTINALKPEAKERIVDYYGDNANLDVFPIIIPDEDPEGNYEMFPIICDENGDTLVSYADINDDAMEVLGWKGEAK